MPQDNMTAQDELNKKVMRNLAKIENDDIEVDKRLSDSDMAVMTIIIVIAIICMAAYLFFVMPNVETVTQKTETQIQIEKDQNLTKYEIDGYTILPEGIAATVNGYEISENKIDDYIERFRAANGVEDQESWSEFVAQGFGDTEDIRDYMIEYYIDQELVKQIADEMGIEVTDELYEARLQNVMESQGLESEDELWEWVSSGGGSVDEYVDTVKVEILRNQIADAVKVNAEDVDDLDLKILGYIQRFYPAYANISSLDEVSDAMIDSARENVLVILNKRAYNKVMDEFIENSDIEVARGNAKSSYDAETGKYQLKELLQTFKRQLAAATEEAGSTDQVLETAE